MLQMMGLAAVVRAKFGELDSAKMEKESIE